MDPFCGCWSRALFWELALCPKFSRYSPVLNDILPPALQLIPKFIFDHRVVWIVRNVSDLMRITFQIEKFDPGFDWCKEPCLLRGELPLDVQGVHFRQDGVGAFLVAIELAPWSFSHEVLDELESLGSNGPHGIMGFIHFIASCKNVPAFFYIFTEQTFPV